MTTRVAPRPPLSKRRIAELIKLRRALSGYAVETSGYEGKWTYEIFTAYSGHWEVARLRKRAYAAPQHFPLSALTLGEWARIKHWQQRRE